MVPPRHRRHAPRGPFRAGSRAALAALWLAGLAGSALGPGSAIASGRLPERSPGEVSPIAPAKGREAFSAPSLSTVDTLNVYHADFENLSSPGNEGGWTHTDQSGAPTAWHIAPTVACQGNSFWAGLIDSSWTGDPDRRGYANNWFQTLTNSVDLTGVTNTVRLGFKHRMNLEPGFDFGDVQVFDPDWDWISLASFSGKIPNNGVCDTFTVVIPDSVIAKTPLVQFRFVLMTDTGGSSADGLYPDAEGWSVDNVTIKAGTNDVRFFDNMEAGMGTWSVSVYPAVGDFWRVTQFSGGQQVCTANNSKVWTPVEPGGGGMVPRMDDLLTSPRIATNGSNQVFATFDLYRNLTFAGCFYYGLEFRAKKPALPWSGWIDPTGVLYYGNENEWLRQNVPLAGAAGAESVQVRIRMKDYAAVFCDGVSSAAGKLLYIDNFDIRVLGSGGPSLSTSESSLFNDTFRTTAFFANDNFNTPQGDSTTVRIGASAGLKLARFHYSLNGAPFVFSALTPVGVAAPDIFYGDVPAAAYARGTELRYFFSATDSANVVATLPDTTGGRYYTATILPRIFSPTGSCPTDTARVLYVNSFAGPDAITGIDQSLSALGIRYDRYDVNAASAGLRNGPGGGDPTDNGVIWPAVSAPALAAMYSAIIWDVGERAQLTITKQDQSLLSSWSSTAGKNRGLILAGDNLAYELNQPGMDVGTFLSCTVGAALNRDLWHAIPTDSLTPTLTGATGTRIESEAFGLDGGCPVLNRFDALYVSACAGAGGRSWLRYPNASFAATERRAALSGTDSVRVVLLGFTLSTMPSAVRRNLLLWRTLVEEMETPYCTTPTGVALGGGAPPARDRLDAPRPNPFNPATEIRFALSRAGRVRVAVYNVAGARVRTLVDGPLEAGEHAVRWDGTDDRGRNSGSAAYFIRMDAPGGHETRKAVLLR